MRSPEFPPLHDIAAWRSMIAAMDQSILASRRQDGARTIASVEEVSIEATRVYIATPDKLQNSSRVLLDLHGGAMIFGGGEVCRQTSIATAGRFSIRTWGLDYRMPPDHPYPAALDDCLATYRTLLASYAPESIAIAGSSAGGNLAVAMVLRARDEGLPMPAALALHTPAIDLTLSGDSFKANLGVDSILTDSMLPTILLYANGHDLSHPYLSPLFGDFARGFPPTILATGTRDLLLSNAVRMHRALRAADVYAELHVLEAGPHGGFFRSAPEDAELDRDIGRFLAKC
jgi:acetyl esterase/lipase